MRDASSERDATSELGQNELGQNELGQKKPTTPMCDASDRDGCVSLALVGWCQEWPDA